MICTSISLKVSSLWVMVMVVWIVGETIESDGGRESDGVESVEPTARNFPSWILGISLHTFRDAPSHFREYN